MNFYEKPLSSLTDEEWEQICMRCGKCCLNKYEEDGLIYFSNQACQFLDIKKCRCSCYAERQDKTGHTCKKVDMHLLENEIDLLPPTCAYRCLYEGRGLPSYHPLLSGHIDSAVRAGQTVKSMPVFAENAEMKAIMALFEVAKKQQWSEDKIKQEVVKVRKKYKLKWLETYPCAAKVEKPTI